jgi:tryptophan synthase alpha subunit
MTETLHQRFQSRVASGHKLLVPYLCAGFPSAEDTLPLLEALADAGADAIELGVPFSDPLMDGPVIQDASRRALDGGMSLAKVLDLAQVFAARRDTPLLIMSSVNPLLRMGPERFAQRAKDAGLSGCILPDLPPEAHLLPGAPPQVQLVAPNTPDERVLHLAGLQPPFLYAVSVLGITGARTTLADYTLPFLQRMKKLSTVPVLAGFGVSTPEQARTMAAACDGIIIGSALLRAIDGPGDLPAKVKQFMEPFRHALD